MQYKWLLFFILIFALIRPGLCPATTQEDAKKLFQKARERCLEQKWKDAFKIFTEIIERFPESRYQDDALFWNAYCMEKMESNPMDIFLAYDKLVSKFPQSPWSDDAMIHQLTIAEKNAKLDDKFYLQFLLDKLKDPNGNIQKEAAFALGRLGDSRSIPVLEKLTANEKLAEKANSLLKKLKSDVPQTPVNPPEAQPEGILDISQSKLFAEPKTGETEKNFLFFPTKRYKQYRAMLRTDDGWTPEELRDFAMYYILPTDDFEEYSILKDYDREEWFRKFWKELDPTPTTLENEALMEFERRIQYVRANFSAYWNARHFKNKRDQYLREGWPHAPWDARGELYIKFGEPDFNSIHSYQAFEWTYSRYNVDFIVRAYQTNIYGEAIYAGTMSRYMHRMDLSRIDSEFIVKPQFRYEHNYHADPLKKFKCSVKGSKSDSLDNVILMYEFPLQELKIIQDQQLYKVSFFEQVVVFNEDMREVMRKEITHTKTGKSSSELKKEKMINNNLTLSIGQGDYLLAIRIADENSTKLGIYRKNFRVQ